MERGKGRARLSKKWFFGAAAVLVAVQLLWGVLGIADPWQGGFFSSGGAYHQAVRNSLEHGYLIPVNRPVHGRKPGPREFYTHWPLGFHWRLVATSALLDPDEEYPLRLWSAIHGVLLLVLLLYALSRWYGDREALLGGAVLVLMPINHTWANAVNQMPGSALWSLAMLVCYLHWREKPTGRHLLFFLIVSGVAFSFTWRPYLIGLCIGFHWLAEYWTTRLRGDSVRGKWWHPFTLAGVGLSYLALHALIMVVETGGIFFGNTAEARINKTERSWENILTVFDRTVLEMMTTPAVIVCGVWLLVHVVALVRRRAQARDLLPLSFLLSAAAFVLLFFAGSFHRYISGFAATGIAIACAQTIMDTGRWLESGWKKLGRRSPSWFAGALSSALAAALVGSMAWLSLPLVEVGRLSAGTFRSRPLARGFLEFADFLRERVPPDTPIAIRRRSFQGLRNPVTRGPHPRYGPGHRFAATVNRPIVWRARNCKRLPEGVIVGRWEPRAMRDIQNLAAGKKFVRYGQYYFIDCRIDSNEVEVWVRVPQPWRWTQIFNGPFETRFNAARAPGLERTLRRRWSRESRRARKRLR